MDTSVLEIISPSEKCPLKCPRCGNDDGLFKLYRVLHDSPIYGKSGSSYCNWCIQDIETNAVIKMPIEEVPLYLFYPFVWDLVNMEAANRFKLKFNNPPEELQVYLAGTHSAEDLKKLLESYDAKNRKPLPIIHVDHQDEPLIA